MDGPEDVEILDLNNSRRMLYSREGCVKGARVREWNGMELGNVKGAAGKHELKTQLGLVGRDGRIHAAGAFERDRLFAFAR